MRLKNNNYWWEFRNDRRYPNLSIWIKGCVNIDIANFERDSNGIQGRER
jgi:hypothetical protein